MSSIVGLARCAEARYPELPPFSPSRAFPEMAFLPDNSLNRREENCVYAAVRRSLYLAGLDAERFGSASWNPLGAFVKPGSRVLINPNLVVHNYDESTRDCVTTHGAIIRAVLDYVYLAGGPTCHIVIADAPEQVAHFGQVLDQTGLPEILLFYEKQLDYQIEVHDLRTVASYTDGKSSFLPPAKRLSGDPLGYVVVDLEGHSELEPITRDDTRFGIDAYSRDMLQGHHKPGRHEYVIARTALEADVLINVPKMKTHQKAGLTCALKNLVGINGCKDWLPHYRLGSPKAGGDEHPDGEWLVGANRAVRGMLNRRSRFLWSVASRIWHSVVRPAMPTPPQRRSGAWYGNDTIWRTILDLNRILSFANREGRMSAHKQRQTFCVVDGVIAGEGNGPFEPTARKAGLILAGDDFAAIDAVTGQLMGYDLRRVPLLARFYEPPGSYWFTEFSGENVRVATDSGALSLEELPSLDFVPPPGWARHVERGGS